LLRFARVVKPQNSKPGTSFWSFEADPAPEQAPEAGAFSRALSQRGEEHH
jgi:hypothetical protein